MNNLSAFALIITPAFTSWFVPCMLNHRRGAWTFSALSMTTLSLIVFLFEPTLISRVAIPLIASAVFFGFLGCISCIVGFHDKRTSTPWLLTAFVSLVITFFTASKVALSLMIIFSLIAVLVAWFQRDTVQHNDQLPALAANNRTRRAGSLPRKFVREGAFHWLPIYAIARLSDLAREGIEHSGSYRFADHIYRNVPSGRTALGRWIDARFLASAASRAFRLRNDEASRALEAACDCDTTTDRTVRMLAVPCGLPRDLNSLVKRRPDVASKIDYHGLDIDPNLLGLAGQFIAPSAAAGAKCTFHEGNALNRTDYPRNDFDVIVSTGLGEFLDDAQLALFYRNIHASLIPGGRFFTSATRREARTEAFLKAFELDTNYRTQPDLERALASVEQPWSRLEFTTDETGLQTFVIATK
ncbi:class I SAM-dependent methyltransferase family protein [Rariglobus hedericola]|nr:class I SAM-dependent methyltransferase family protein [Rariglobus hedericola]